ncbi:MAG: iron-sulfur cluster assembly scaffold protein [Verrucomicrobia bacterium]|nr:iron-sulfur cluster assembly scaffold protein [Verrucomicrobiota bacterium]MBS0637454.1 iron-sulfur cluster assembly scaffold protein [Verrucomicrobiota bacterium]
MNYWSRYSKKLALRIENPYCVGVFTDQDGLERDVHVARGASGSFSSGKVIQFYWLVDKTDGVIVDSRFQAYGPSALIGAAEVVSELVIGRNYDQAGRITSELIDRHVRDKNDLPAFPEETYSEINAVLEALDKAVETCKDIPLSQSYVAPPITARDVEVVEGGYPGFMELPLKQKLAVIEEVIAKEIRPYIELDAGGVEVINFLNDKEVIIAYQGSCTSCYSATGATLSFIQQVLRAKVHPDLDVIPNM